MLFLNSLKKLILNVIILHMEILQSIKSRSIHLKRMKNWVVRLYEMKVYPVIGIPYMFLKNVFFFVFFVMLVLKMLVFINLISLNNSFPNIAFNSSFEISNDIGQQLAISQISSTFIITAILSLIANIDDKYIYGEKAIKTVFRSRLFNFSLIFIVLIFLLFMSLSFLITDTYNHIFICCCLSSFILLSWLIFNVLKVFIHSNSIKKFMEILYYKENLKVLRSFSSKRDWNSDKLGNLRQKCLELIIVNKSGYMDYTTLYLNLIGLTLFNHPKQMQEFHTELTYSKDLFDDFIVIIKDLLVVDAYKGIRSYELLLNKLNYYNIHIQDYSFFELFKSMVELLAQKKEYLELKEGSTQMARIATELLEQVYICENTDLSYTRLGEEHRMNALQSNLFSQIYNKVYQNKYIEIEEKQDIYLTLYDSFRMAKHELKTKWSDIKRFSYKSILPEKRCFDSYIFAFPTSKLLLSTLKNKDLKNYNLFSNMNIGKEDMNLAKMLMLLSLINIKESKSFNSPYSDYYKMDIKWTKQFIKKSDLSFDPNLFEGAYKSITKHCDTKSCNTGGYMHDYSLCYKKILVDSFFSYLAKKYDHELLGLKEDESLMIMVKEMLD